MKICKSISEFDDWAKEIPQGLTIGFVPTMGGLHEGHLSLIKKSKKCCNINIVSIFINELQFSPEEDFENYPRTLAADLKLLNQEKIDAVFMPNAKEIYPENFTFQVYESKISKNLEGISRPNFFTGVTTIVSKLLNIVEPTDAFFGMKDIQQLSIIKKMVQELNYKIKIHSCPTIREKNGLAMSS